MNFKQWLSSEALDTFRAAISDPQAPLDTFNYEGPNETIWEKTTQVGPYTYDITISKMGERAWEVFFDKQGGKAFELSHDFQALPVLDNVLRILYSFVKKQEKAGTPPEVIEFRSNEQEKSRVRTYLNLAKRYAPMLGYSISTQTIPSQPGTRKSSGKSGWVIFQLLRI